MESKQKRTALVTGGSSGIGRCTAVALSKAGYLVYEFSRRDIPVEGVKHMSVDVTDGPIDEDFKTLLANTIEDAADDSGWAFLGIVGGVLTKKMPDFDPRNYGYKKLSLLVKSLSKIVEIEERPSENKELKLVYVRNRIR